MDFTDLGPAMSNAAINDDNKRIAERVAKLEADLRARAAAPDIGLTDLDRQLLISLAFTVRGLLTESDLLQLRRREARVRDLDARLARIAAADARQVDRPLPAADAPGG
jgi:hypothetical protein